MTYKLVQEDAPWFSLVDYGAVLEVVERLRPRTVLEFGPGTSTLALIEGGVRHVDACEDDPVYCDRHRIRLVSRFPDVVRLVEYEWSDPLTIRQTDGLRYDLGMIDGPRETLRRPTVIDYCLQRCDRVLVFTEDDEPEGARYGAPIPIACYHLAAKYRRRLEFTRTGPCAGGIALIGPPC